MPYQPLTPEQYKKAREKFTHEQIVSFEQKRKASSASTAAQEKPGLVKSVVQSVANIPTRLISSVAPVVETLQGKSQAEIARRNVEGRDFGYFGENKRPLGYQASQYQLGKKGVGEAAFSMAKDVAGLGLEAGSYAVPVGKVIPAVKPTILGGAIGQGIKTGASSGLKSGALAGAGSELQDENATVGSTLKSTAIGAGTGLAVGSVLGGVLPAPAATKKFIQGQKAGTNAANIMNRVAKVHPSVAEKFKHDAGEDIGTYLTKRGIYEHDDALVKKLYENFNKSKSIVDETLAKELGGTRLKNEGVDEMLSMLYTRAEAVSSPGAESSYLQTTKNLIKESQDKGLTMSQINEIKRLFEKHIKLNYAKNRLTPNTKAIEKANNLDTAVREWQVKEAERLGFTNLAELNNETKLAYQLANGLFQKMSRSQQNNGLGLREAILLSGGDINSIGMTIAFRVGKSNAVQTRVAKQLGGKATVGDVTAKIRPPVKAPSRQLPPGATPMPGKTSQPISAAERAANAKAIVERQRENTLKLPAGRSSVVSGPTIKATAPASVEKGVPKPNYPDSLDLSKLNTQQLRLIRKRVASQLRLARKKNK